MQMKTTFTFTSILESVNFNSISTAVFLPHHIIVELPKGKIRVSGIINGAPFSLAIQYRKDGSRYFSVGAPLRKAAKIQAGDKVNVSFRILDLQNVELPESFEYLSREGTSANTILPLSDGTKKFLATYIAEVKNIDSRIRRAVETVKKGKAAVMQAQQNKKNRNK
jgi:hypothetical protein